MKIGPVLKTESPKMEEKAHRDVFLKVITFLKLSALKDEYLKKNSSASLLIKKLNFNFFFNAARTDFRNDFVTSTILSSVGVNMRGIFGKVL